MYKQFEEKTQKIKDNMMMANKKVTVAAAPAAKKN